MIVIDCGAIANLPFPLQYHFYGLLLIINNRRRGNEPNMAWWAVPHPRPKSIDK